MALTNNTVSMLFGLAAGRCSICKTPVVKRHVKIGEMAHIIAKRTGGARGNLPLVSSRDGYENLILLCPNHHTEVDNDEKSYPPEKLRRLKNEHEYYVDQIFKCQTQARSMDIGALKGLMQYLPLTQVRGLLNGLPTSFNMKLFCVEETCENFCEDFPHCRPFFDPHLEEHFMAFWSGLCHLNNHIKTSNCDGKPAYDTSPRYDSNNLYLSRDLSHEDRQKVEEKTNELRINLNAKHDFFLQFLKHNYPEVNLSSFLGW